MATLPDSRYLAPPFAAARWPTEAVEPLAGESCVQLVAAVGSAPAAVLVGDPGEAAASAGVAVGRRAVTVEAGRGAVVASGEWGRASSESRVLVDRLGRAYPLDGPEVVALLGYADTPVPVVPDSWLALMEPGVVLSQEAALCPPDPEGGSACG
jgi:hypothetical protein